MKKLMVMAAVAVSAIALNAANVDWGIDVYSAGSSDNYWDGKTYYVINGDASSLTRLSKKREKTPALPEFSLFSVSFASVFPLHQSSPSSIVLPSIFGGGCGGRRRPSCERTSATSFLGSP